MHRQLRATLLLLLLTACTFAHRDLVTQTLSTITCTTASGSTKVQRLPRTTTTVSIQSTTTLTATSTLKKSTTTPSPTTIQYVSQTSTITLQVSSTSIIGPTITSSTTQTVSVCSDTVQKRDVLDGNKDVANKEARAARTIFPSQVFCTQSITLLTRTTSTVTVAGFTDYNAGMVITATSTTQVFVYETETAWTTMTGTATSTTTITLTTTVPIPSTILVPAAGTYATPYSYTLFFSGTGLRTDPSTNPGNPTAYTPWYPFGNTSLPATLSACDAITQCANLTANGNIEVYASFDVHLVEGVEWVCVQYFGGNSDAGTFDVEDASVGSVYGFTYDDMYLGLGYDESL